MGQVIRKGPKLVLTCMQPLIKFTNTTFNSNPEIQSLSALLNKKAEVNSKLKGILNGNFYFSDITDFKKMSIQDISDMVAYLQLLILYVSQRLIMESSELVQSIIAFVCDEIHDLISTVIMCVISLRKDNELQLRRDKLADL
jgi:hypothetical protein